MLMGLQVTLLAQCVLLWPHVDLLDSDDMASQVQSKMGINLEDGRENCLRMLRLCLSCSCCMTVRHAGPQHT